MNRKNGPIPRSLTSTSSLRSELRVEDSRVAAGLASESLNGGGPYGGCGALPSDIPIHRDGRDLQEGTGFLVSTPRILSEGPTWRRRVLF
jgi:hypothetical protein